MLIFSEDIVNEIVNKSRESNNKECTITLNVSRIVQRVDKSNE